MSELKAHRIVGMNEECARVDNDYYLKSEVGKVIAEKDEEIRHQKYRRCLAMAKVLEHVCPITNRKAKWRKKWHLRWLALAEKLKEAK